MCEISQYRVECIGCIVFNISATLKIRVTEMVSEQLMGSNL